MKKISIVLVIMLLCTGMSFAATVPSDVQGNVYEEAITALLEKGIITGDVDGKFYPDSRLTRAQACIMVVKAMNPPDSEITGTVTQIVKSGFPDMTGYGWADGYIAYAVKKGVVKGYPDGTFKPGDLVKIEEITTMVMRAGGYTDQNLGGSYPSNYMERGTSIGLFDDMVTILIYPMQVTKAMTAQILFNGLAMIEKANPQTPAEDNNGEFPAKVPTLTGKTFLTGTFNSMMTEFAGKAIASDVKVYATGEKIEYKSSMTLSKEVSDFRIDTIYKYKNVNTPIWYAMKGNEISEIILPMDVGFSGYAYGVINGIVSALNVDGDKVDGMKTLVAENPVMWLGIEGLAGIPDSAEYLAGMVYEFRLSNGEIRSIATAENGREIFVELTESMEWNYVYSFENGILRLQDADGELIEVKGNAAVYVLSEDETEYTAGTVSSIKAERGIRAFDVTDDDDHSADIVVVTTMTIK